MFIIWKAFFFRVPIYTMSYNTCELDKSLSLIDFDVFHPWLAKCLNPLCLIAPMFPRICAGIYDASIIEITPSNTFPDKLSQRRHTSKDPELVMFPAFGFSLINIKCPFILVLRISSATGNANFLPASAFHTLLTTFLYMMANLLSYTNIIEIIISVFVSISGNIIFTRNANPGYSVTRHLYKSRQLFSGSLQITEAELKLKSRLSENESTIAYILSVLPWISCSVHNSVLYGHVPVLSESSLSQDEIRVRFEIRKFDMSGM